MKSYSDETSESSWTFVSGCGAWILSHYLFLRVLQDVKELKSTSWNRKLTLVVKDLSFQLVLESSIYSCKPLAFISYWTQLVERSKRCSRISEAPSYNDKQFGFKLDGHFNHMLNFEYASIYILLYAWAYIKLL